MKDFQIREVLRRTALVKYYSDGHSKVVEEMKIPVARARIDMAVINGSFHGYEIKGASDTLHRLPNQLIAYSYIFDYLTIITEAKHREKIEALTPAWVGIAICTSTTAKEFKIVKKPRRNPEKNSFHIAKLLWRQELIQLLSNNGISFKKKDRTWILCETLAANLDTKAISSAVREIIKSRVEWKD